LPYFNLKLKNKGDYIIDIEVMQITDFEKITGNKKFKLVNNDVYEFEFALFLYGEYQFKMFFYNDNGKNIIFKNLFYFDHISNGYHLAYYSILT